LLAIHADFAEVAAPAAVARAALRELGRLDILVNNAGVTFWRPIAQLDAGSFDRVVAIDVRAPFLLMKDVADIAALVAFLASDEASFITGQVIYNTGASTARSASAAQSGVPTEVDAFNSVLRPPLHLTCKAMIRLSPGSPRKKRRKRPSRTGRVRPVIADNERLSRPLARVGWHRGEAASEVVPRCARAGAGTSSSRHVPWQQGFHATRRRAAADGHLPARGRV
jgi:hypothetical protein